jgi:hypothetical protein
MHAIGGSVSFFFFLPFFKPDWYVAVRGQLGIPVSGKKNVANCFERACISQIFFFDIELPYVALQTIVCTNYSFT